MIRDLVIRNRSCRRFIEEHCIDLETLKRLVDLARMSASAANRQPLKYILSADPGTNARIFECLAWAAYLTDWPGPAPGERPSAYIVMLGDTTVTTNYWCDHGIASQSILLGAREMGLAGCMIGAIRKEQLARVLDIPSYLEILLVLAIGKPGEEAVLDDLGPDGDIRYWRDPNGVHHVPKRKLEDIIIACH